MINEILFFTVLIICFLFTLIVTKLGKEWLLLLPPIFLVIANIFASQITSVFGIFTSLAVALYACIFLTTDIIEEHWGKAEAGKAVWMGLLSQVALVVFSQLMIRGSVIEFSQPIREALTTIFSFTPRIVLGSFIAYLISQNWDIWIYQTLKEMTKGRHLWLRNNVGTITSQFIDTVIFITIAFYGVLPTIIPFILSVWVLKILIALLDTPFIYLSYWVLGKKFPKKHEHFHSSKL